MSVFEKFNFSNLDLSEIYRRVLKALRDALVKLVDIWQKNAIRFDEREICNTLFISFFQRVCLFELKEMRTEEVIYMFWEWSSMALNCQKDEWVDKIFQYLLKNNLAVCWTPAASVLVAKHFEVSMK